MLSASLAPPVLCPVQRLEAEMGRREPSVRELFRTASRLAQTFIVRQPPAGSAHASGCASARLCDCHCCRQGQH